MQMQNLELWEITVIALICAMYFLPAFIAFLRQCKNMFAIFLLNILLGWTVLGWVISLIWSVI
jgi:Superinfection immunity protein